MKVHYCLALCLAVVCSQTLLAQWTNTGGPPSRVIQCFTVTDSTILAGTDGGLVRSTNNGFSWSNVGGGLPYSNVRALLSVASYPFNALAGMTSGRISSTTNYGTAWIGFPIDSVQLPALAHINAISTDGTEFWAGTDRGIYLLPQYYPLASWIPYSSGFASGEFTKVRTLLQFGGELYAGTDSGIYKLVGSSWVQKNTGLLGTNVSSLTSAGGLLIAGATQGSNDGVYLSSDGGENWALSKAITSVTSVFAVGSSIFAGSFGDGVWSSTDHGATWGQINDGFAGAAYYVMSLAASDQYLFAGTNNANVWRRVLSQVATEVIGGPGVRPQAYSLEQNYPNPFNPSTSIAFRLSARSTIRLAIFSTLGERIAVVAEGEWSAGRHVVEWDASRVATGAYFYRLEATDASDASRGFTEVKTMLIMK